MGGYFYELLFIPTSFYVLINLCMDINQKMYYFYVSRSSFHAYLVAKVLVGVMFSFAVSFLALLLYIAVFSACMPMLTQEPTADLLYRSIHSTSPYVYFWFGV